MPPFVPLLMGVQGYNHGKFFGIILLGGEFQRILEGQQIFLMSHVFELCFTRLAHIHFKNTYLIIISLNFQVKTVKKVAYGKNGSDLFA
jgi:hypothetical protein